MTPAVKHVKQKYMVIDITTVETTHIVHVCYHNQAQLWGQILKAQGRNVIAPPVEGRGFSGLDRLPMQYLYWNLTKEAPSDDFSVNIKKCLEIVQNYPMDDHTEEALMRMADSYRSYADPATGKPKEVDPHAAPKKQGGTTALVWELADSVLAKHGGLTDATDWKVLRGEIVEACRGAGINDGTTGVQYSKWKAAKLAKK